MLAVSKSREFQATIDDGKMNIKTLHSGMQGGELDRVRVLIRIE